MKILILANYDVGLYQFRRELIAEMLKTHEVYVSLPFGELVRPLQEMGCKFIDTPLDRRGIDPVTDMGLFLRYRKMLREVKPDMVITYTIKPNIYGGLACRLARVPYAANITGLGTAFQNEGLLKKLVTLMYRTALKRAKTVFFENSGNMDTLLELGVVCTEQCRLLPGAGVNLEHYGFAAYPDVDGETRFLFIGRVMKEKGVDELFVAMERLYSEGMNCRLDVLGSFEEHYEERIRDAESDGWLRYHGYQTDVRPFIAGAHCFVLPSWHEGMANTLLECAAMGRPLITSRIHGCMEAVIEGESGLLCEAKDAESLYRTMRQFCGMSRDAREAMGRAGSRHMENKFDKKLVVRETVEALGVWQNR